MAEDKDQRNTEGKPLTLGDKLDFWNKDRIREEDKHEVQLIDDEAIRNGSTLNDEQRKKFSENLASGTHDNYCEVIALSADIRKSAITLVNVEDYAEYNRVLADFICYIKDTWRYQPGRFFDKFTGDGALCFWVLPEEPKKDDAEKEVDKDRTLIQYYYDEWNKRIRETIDFSIEITCKFMEILLPRIRKTCGLIPKDFGFSIGIDVGECFLTELRSSKSKEAPEDDYKEQYGKIKCEDYKTKGIVVSDNVTIIGRPVIGATRMTRAAKAYEILVNCYPGSALKARIDDPKEHKIRKHLRFGLDLAFRKIKDYCYAPVEVYRVNTDRIEHLKRQLGLVEEDQDSSIKSEKEPDDTTCKESKKK